MSHWLCCPLYFLWHQCRSKGRGRGGVLPPQFFFSQKVKSDLCRQWGTTLPDSTPLICWTFFSHSEMLAKMRDYLFHVTLNCLRRVTRSFWWANLTNNKLRYKNSDKFLADLARPGQMRPLVPLVGGFITLQPKPLTFLSSTGVEVFTGPGISKSSRPI